MSLIFIFVTPMQSEQNGGTPVLQSARKCFQIYLHFQLAWQNFERHCSVSKTSDDTVIGFFPG